jgi:3-methylcrotonyl-CoA carboxylase beta subunit
VSHVPVVPIGAPLERLLGEVERGQNLAAMQEREALLTERRAEVAGGWGQKYVDRVHAKGKLTAHERLDLLADADSPRLAVGTFVNYGEVFGGKLKSPGAGVVTCFLRVHGRWVMVIANDNTVASGSWWPRTPEKIERAQDMARRLRVPLVYLVDCSGLFLPEQSRSFPGAAGGGHIFTMNALLSAQGVPQIAGVFGDCIAGGGYMPIISDRVIMTEQAYMVIAGAALLKGAKSQKITSLDIGGPEVHCHQSGCADVRVPDDRAAIDWIRREVATLPGSAADYYRAGAAPTAPAHPPRDLAALVPTDHRHAYDARQVLARLVDASLFWELWPDTGAEVIVGVGRVGGLYCGFAINQVGLVPHPDEPRRERPGGILYREGIAKLAQFSRACHADGLPLVWLQDVSGFDIGAEAERLGLLGWGSSLIYANSVQQAPVFTVLLRRASGAGYYAMNGRPYDPIVQLSTPVSRLSVMEGRTLAIATYNTKLDDEFQIATEDPAERAEIARGMQEVEARIEADMDPYVSARQLDTDEIVPLGELRLYLEGLVEMTYQGTGYRTVKNPRIWSLHDLAALDEAAPVSHARPHEPHQACLAQPGEDGTTALASPRVGIHEDAPAPGTYLAPGMPVGRVVTLGVPHTVVVPPGVAGFVTGAAPSTRRCAVDYGATLVVVRPAAEGSPVEAEVVSAAEPGLEAGHLVLRAPQMGRLYQRPSPDQPPYVKPGDVLSAGSIVALIEVMKTFFQVRYGDPALGAGLPERARVVRFLVDDGADLDHEQPFLELEAAE